MTRGRRGPSERTGEIEQEDDGGTWRQGRDAFWGGFRATTAASSQQEVREDRSRKRATTEEQGNVRVGDRVGG